ncbi:hypothetical protein CWATWH0005_881 [Crocosphaera watsonii WH 0005]|uniref:Uncharacterized protein n=1 Tax=Crocosphaera watsonii WH 0005 TaxID=423472 RepID=T2IY87_CROWT|nr:hypothetical protein CWATWH0005_881 [Crocosphaera watsonii WH 0005]
MTDGSLVLKLALAAVQLRAICLYQIPFIEGTCGFEIDRDLNAAKVLANQAVGYTVGRLWTEYRRRFAVVAGSKTRCISFM